ncbi:hypothetical protein EGM51_09795 [Verrucomicrobia bacterium S94]|nr:hypothetical protein EGM51_09795 [Verrucomicrobia bacterium S94]
MNKSIITTLSFWAISLVAFGSVAGGFRVDSNEAYQNLPLVTYTDKYSTTGKIHFNLVYRETLPFNSRTYIFVGVRDEKGKEVFSGLLRPKKYYIGNGFKHIQFQVHESNLTNSTVSIETGLSDESSKLFPNKYGSSISHLALIIDLNDLYNWSSPRNKRSVSHLEDEKNLYELSRKQDMTKAKWESFRKSISPYTSK